MNTETDPKTASSQTRAGFVAVIGAPNAGKSTLVNALVGTKVSIVSHKVQTTRSPVRGVAMRGNAQLVLVDTPGIFQPRRRLDRAMVNAAWSGAGDADVVLLIVDAADLAAHPEGPAARDTYAILDELKKTRRKAALVLNKIDAMKRAELLPLVGTLNREGLFEQVFMISALKGEAIGDVADWCAAHMPEGPFLYPPDQAADIPSRLLAAEITREKLYLRLHDELPYATTVETEKWEEKKDGSARIDQIIYVQREGQKAIVLGKGGKAIKAIGESARARDGRPVRPPHPPLPLRQGARGLGRQPRALSRNRAGVSGGQIGVEWSDDAIVLSVRAHGETSAIVDALTRAHGRHAGLVRGGASRKSRAVLQPGNSLHLVWRARLAEHLGSFTVEPARARSGRLMETRAGLMGLNAFTSVTQAALPEREPHAFVYEAAVLLLDAMAEGEFADWGPLFVRWEVGLLEELGFGLDFSQCAATGATDDLSFVSPRSGRAVSRAAAAPWRERLFALPPFLLGSQNAVMPEDIAAGLRLTGHFLAERVLVPHGRKLPAPRIRLEELAGPELD